MEHSIYICSVFWIFSAYVLYCFITSNIVRFIALLPSHNLHVGLDFLFSGLIIHSLIINIKMDVLHVVAVFAAIVNLEILKHCICRIFWNGQWYVLCEKLI